MKSDKWVIVDRNKFVVGLLVYQTPKSFVFAKLDSIYRFGVLRGGFGFRWRALPVGKIVFEDYTIKVDN